jgi:hypothetical protein
MTRFGGFLGGSWQIWRGKFQSGGEPSLKKKIESKSKRGKVRRRSAKTKKNSGWATQEETIGWEASKQKTAR